MQRARKRAIQKAAQRAKRARKRALQKSRSAAHGLAVPFMELLVGKLDGKERSGAEPPLSTSPRYLGAAQPYRETLPKIGCEHMPCAKK